MIPISKRVMAECLGTFWLVFMGCGSAIFSAAYPQMGIGFLGVSVAFGLSVLTMAYAIGDISGAHLNPAVTMGMAMARRIDLRHIVPYVMAQVLGATIAAIVLYVIATGNAEFSVASGFAANGYGEHSPGGYGLASAFWAELIFTFMFVFIALGATDRTAPAGFAPIAIGLALTVIHLVAIPITNASINPARSTGQAIVVGGWAVSQLWVFWMSPLIGGLLAGVAYPALAARTATQTPELVRVSGEEAKTPIVKVG